jgi:hypothetical protein
MVFRSRNAPAGRGDDPRSRTSDWRPGITRERVIGVPKHEANRFFCPVADITANRRTPSFLFGGVPCRMNVIKQTVTATWRRSTVASQEAPQPKCETAISGWQSIIASWLRPRSGAHLLVRPSGWRVAPCRVPLGRRSPGPSPPTRPSARCPITFLDHRLNRMRDVKYNRERRGNREDNQGAPYC